MEEIHQNEVVKVGMSFPTYPNKDKRARLLRRPFLAWFLCAHLNWERVEGFREGNPLIPSHIPAPCFLYEPTFLQC